MLREQHSIKRLSEALFSPKVWLLSYFCIVIGMYGIALWLPQIIKDISEFSEIGIGVVSAIPYLLAALVMTIVGYNSDRTGERRLHTAGSIFLASIGLIWAACSVSPTMQIAALCLAAMGIWGTLGPFWALSTSFLAGSAAAGGIALINSIGNLGGFIGPYLVGVIKEMTGSFKYALTALSLIILLGMAMVFLIKLNENKET